MLHANHNAGVENVLWYPRTLSYLVPGSITPTPASFSCSLVGKLSLKATPGSILSSLSQIHFITTQRPTIAWSKPSFISCQVLAVEYYRKWMGQSEGLQDRVREKEIGGVTYPTQAQSAGSLYICLENRPETTGKARTERPALSSVQDPILCDSGPKQVDDSSSQEKRKTRRREGTRLILSEMVSAWEYPYIKTR